MLHRDGDTRRLILVYLGTFCAVIFLCGGCDPVDKQALLEFKAGLVDPGGFLFSTWHEDTDCCISWKGVTCSNETGRAVKLEMVSTYQGASEFPHRNRSYEGLVGSSLGKLESLEVLRFVNVLFEGPLPPKWADLKNLQTLDCVVCSFEGSIDQFHWENLSKLGYISLERSENLTGPIPPEICKLSSLLALKLSSNLFIDSIPACIGELDNLEELYLGANNLTGNIPMSIGSLTKLWRLELHENRIGGLIPSLSNLTGLTVLWLYNNELTGQIPTSLCALPILGELLIYSNQLNGTIPECLGHMPSLSNLELDDNRLSGNFPRSLLQIPTVIASRNSLANWSWDVSSTFSTGLIKQLELATNNFSGPLPLALCNLSSVTRINLAENNFTGPLLPCLGELRQGVVLNTSFNLLDGEIPATFGSGNFYALDLKGNNLSGGIDQVFTKQNYDYGVNGSLTYVDLSQNQLSGQVPKDLALQQQLTYLRLSDNKLNGGFPSCVFNLTELNTLDISHNEFSGQLPSSLPAVASTLERLSLGYNNFSGRIPAYYDGPDDGSFSESSSLGGSWDNCKLISFSVRDNKLTGAIPDSIGDCEDLILFDASNNQFNGPLPSWFYTSTNLRVFMVSNNQIEGTITDMFGLTNSSSLRVLSLSNNKLQGQIPSRTLHSLELFTDASRSEEEQQLITNKFTTLGTFDSYRESIVVSFKGGGTFLTVTYLLYAPILLDFSNNQLTGPIPSTIGLLSQITTIKLSNNFLSGGIPPEMEKLLQIQTMDLSNNSLNGSIPSGFRRMSFLGSVNFSYNHLSGSIPDGTQWPTYPVSAFMQNDGLCGLPTPVRCPVPDLPTPAPAPSSSTSASVQTFPPASLSVAVSIPAFVLGYLLSFFVCSYLLNFRFGCRRRSFKLSFTASF